MQHAEQDVQFGFRGPETVVEGKGDSIYRASLKMVRDVQGPWRGGARLLPCLSVLFTDGLRDTRWGHGEGGSSSVCACARAPCNTCVYDGASLVEIRRNILSSHARRIDGEGGG